MKKRFLSLLFVMVMVIGVMPIAAAANKTEISSISIMGMPVVSVGDKTPAEITYTMKLDGKSADRSLKALTVRWTTTDSDNFTGTFEKGKPYYLVFELTALDTKEFSSDFSVTQVNAGVVEPVEISEDKAACFIKIRMITPTETPVKLNANGGTINSGNIEKYVEGFGVTLPTDVTKAGYTFDGWFENEDLSGSALTEIGIEATGIKEFYAKWTAIEYNITYNLDGGTNAAGNPVSYTIEDTVTLEAPTKADHTFDGWTWDGQSEPVADVTFTGSTGDKAYTANWTAVPVEDEDEEEDEPIIDVTPDDWFYDEVVDVYEKDLMNGIDWKKFAPNDPLTRAMVVTILWRLEGEPVVNYLMQFEDVPADTWYTEAVCWAASEKIVEGYSQTEFAPDDLITREQFATILWRYAKHKGMDVSVGENTNILSYEDALDISEWAIPAMQWACGSGLMEGTGAYLMPKGTTTRAQAAAVLSRFIG